MDNINKLFTNLGFNNQAAEGAATAVAVADLVALDSVNDEVESEVEAVAMNAEVNQLFEAVESIEPDMVAELVSGDAVCVLPADLTDVA